MLSGFRHSILRNMRTVRRLHNMANNSYQQASFAQHFLKVHPMGAEQMDCTTDL